MYNVFEERSAVICCTSLAEFLAKAQKRMGTDIPVYYIDEKYHLDPKLMREKLLEVLAALPEEIDTVLVGMGHCGGVWEGVPAGKRRIVAPVCSDCISLLLASDGRRVFDRKDVRHLYIKDGALTEGPFKRLYEESTASFGEEEKRQIYGRWRELFDAVDIVDTGLFDTHAEGFEAAAREDAEWLGVPLVRSSGSIVLLEKLVSGDWDEQFEIFGPGEFTLGERYRGVERL